jgi:hypothetical protein
MWEQWIINVQIQNLKIDFNITHNDSGIEDPLYSKHKKKKKTKHSDNEEVLEMSESHKQKKHRNKIQKHQNDTEVVNKLTFQP